MATADRTRQLLSAYRGAVVFGVVGAALVTTAGVTEDHGPPKPRVVSDGRTVTLPPITVTTTTTVTAAPTQTSSPSGTPGPSMLPSSLPSPVPSAITSPTPTPPADTSSTPSPSPTRTPKNHANGLNCFVLVEVDHGILIKVPCKE